MRIYIILNFLGICSLNLFATGNDSSCIKYANTITANELKEHLYILASPEYEGRETGMAGQKMAAKYLSDKFNSYGLSSGNGNSYYQEFPLITYNPEGVCLNIKNDVKESGKDFFYYLTDFRDTMISFNNVLFLGYGIEDSKYDDYKGVDVKNKLLIVLDGEPVKNGKHLISGDEEPSEWTINQRKKIFTAHNNGAAGILLIKNGISDNIKHMMDKNRMKLDNGELPDKSVYSFFITSQLGEEILKANGKENIKSLESKINSSGQGVSFEISIPFIVEIKTAIEKIKSENVLAFIEGSDLKDEIIVITAHYDHLGIKDDKIFVGADDDGSGTVSLLELAQAFAQAKNEGKGPRRSILFMPVSGEEKGLLGSEYYSQNPVFPLKNTVANLNIDMIGRIDEMHKDRPEFIYLIGSDKLSTELHKLSEEANKKYVNLEIDYTYNHPDDPNRFYYRSDHYNFAKHNIPIIFYFNGTHADYHKYTDTPDKIDYRLMEKRAKLVFYTAWELVNRDERIKVDVVNDFKSE